MRFLLNAHVPFAILFLIFVGAMILFSRKDAR